MSGNLNHFLRNLRQDSKNHKGALIYDLSDAKVYNKHACIIKEIGDRFLAEENKEFNIDEHNNKILRFLLYYFNKCELANEVFPERGYNLRKNILLCGVPGTGKTLIMMIFEEYLKVTENKLAFNNLSVTQLMNHYKTHSHIDKYTFNEENASSFEGNPFSICLNDFGLDTEKQKHYGTDLKAVIDEFLYARYDIWQFRRLKYYLTTNLSKQDLKEKYDPRLYDRFKAFNTLPLAGKTRR